MATYTSDFPSALKDTLLEAWQVGFDGEDAQYKKVFNVRESSDNYETMLQFQGPDTIPVSGEGQVFERVEIESVREKTFYWIIYKGEIKITREALDDNKYQKIVDGSQHIGSAVARTIDSVAASFFYNGLIGSEMTPDSKAVFAADHTLSNPLPGKMTSGRNLGTGALSVDNIKRARILGRKTPDEHGSVSPYELSQLIVPADLEDEAEIIRESMQKPGTANNDKNVTGPKIKEVVVLDYLAEAPSNASTQWFLRDPRANKSRNMFFWRVKPEKKIVKDDASDDFLFRCYMRFGLGAADWRGLFGATGASGSSSVLY